MALFGLINYKKKEWPTHKYASTTSILLLQEKERGYSDAFLLILHGTRNYLHIYNLYPTVAVIQGESFSLLLANEKWKKIRKQLETWFALRIDYCIRSRPETPLNLLRSLGGTEFINLTSSAIEKGRIFINARNYLPFLQEIDHPVLRKDTAYSLWYNLLYTSLSFYSSIRDEEKLARIIYSHLRTDIPRRQFKRQIRRFANHCDQFYVSYSRMNIQKMLLSDEEIHTPIGGGEYDRIKLHGIIQKFEQGEMQIDRFPIHLQVKNGTSVSRLAARTAGVLRMKRCNVREYLNSGISIERSFIIDSSGSPVKRDHLKKITRIEDCYYLIDYREKFDFTLYLGEDYYAIR